MDPFTAIGTAMAVGGFVQSLFGDSDAKRLAQQQNKIAKQIAANSMEENNIRKQAATNDYMQATRQNIRAAQVARATALSNATNQGAQYGSGLQGGYGQIAGQASDTQTGVFSDYTAGQSIFDLDNKNAGLQTQYNALGGKIQIAQSQGSGLLSLGTSIVANGEKLTNGLSGIKNVFSGT